MNDIAYPCHSILISVPQAKREQETVFCEIQTVKKSCTNLPPLFPPQIPKPALSNRNRIQTTNVTHICNFKFCSNHSKRRNMKLILMFIYFISQHVIYIKNQNEMSNIFRKSEVQGASDTCTSPSGLATF